MQPYSNIAKMEVEELLGEWHPLVDQLGSSDGLLPLSSATSALAVPHISTRTALVSLLENYKSEILIPLELPAIVRAYRHACRHETRELIGFDRELARQAWVPALARASQRSGQQQLRRLRPLRDHRLLQRYLLAVEEEQAHGWHTLVYGVSLSIYSLPVMQGLGFYERQTLRGFVHGAARSLGLSHCQCREILNHLCADLPARLGHSEPRDSVAVPGRSS